jgi:hypothetical protein
MVDKKKTVKWVILKRFTFGDKVYNLGEIPPNFISNKEKEKLYLQGKLGKLNSDGSLDKHIQAFNLSGQDIKTIGNNPQMISYIVGEYVLYKEDLREIWNIVLKKPYAKQFEKFIIEKLKVSPEKTSSTVAKKETVETENKGENNGK